MSTRRRPAMAHGRNVKLEFTPGSQSPMPRGSPPQLPLPWTWTLLVTGLAARSSARSTSRSSFYCCAALRANVGRGRASSPSIGSHSLPVGCWPACCCMPWIPTTPCSLIPSSQGLTSISHHTHRGAPCSIHSFSSSLAFLIYYGYKYSTGRLTRP